MTYLPVIYTIQASDAPQHTGKLQEILQNLIKERRIGDFKTLHIEGNLSAIAEDIRDEVLILILLTNQLKSQKDQLENWIKTLKAAHPEARIAEIIVDNLAYDNEFITFPTDLRPIRGREDMDTVWHNIGKSLKDMFPVQEYEPDPPVVWSKYLKIAGILIGVILVFFIIWQIMGGGNGSLSDRPLPVRPPVTEEEVTEQPVNEPVQPVSPAPLPGEDCKSFNHRNLRVLTVGNQFFVAEGSSRIMLFSTREQADLALRIIRHYRLDNRCFAVQPDPGLVYFKSGGNIPSGSFAGEDCIGIRDPQNLTVSVSTATSFQILDGNSILYTANSRTEATRIVDIVKHYNARFTCFVGRPDPGMVYLRM